VGWGRAAELVLTGEAGSGGEAERWGLVNRVVADDDLDREVADWTARLLALPPRAVRLQKDLLRRWRGVDLESAITLSMETFAQAYATDEPRRVMDAFLARDRGPAD
jgi:enoyl-CoA hydratase/carnithine racemase